MMGSICPSDTTSAATPHTTSKRTHHNDEDDDQDSSNGSQKRLKSLQNTKGQIAEPPKKISFGLAQKSAGTAKISFGGFKMGVQKPAAPKAFSSDNERLQSSKKVKFPLCKLS